MPENGIGGIAMIICTICDGKGRLADVAGMRRCEQCDGSGMLIDPQLERLIKAVEKVAQELGTLCHIAEREERGRGAHRLY